MDKQFKDIIQIQLLTRRNHPRVYFVTDKIDNKKYVIKGPLDEKYIKNILRTENIKKELNINNLNGKMIEINNEKYIRFDSLINYSNDKIKKSSKIEGEVEVYNGKNCNLVYEDIIKDKELFMEFMKYYLCKILVGASDFCSRNFIRKENKIYSVDDHYSRENIESLDKIKMKRCIWLKFYELIIKNKKDIINNIINDWKNILKDNKYLLLRLNKIENIIIEFK